ncbi:histidinol-phosphatase HisJ family protein [Paenibacillus psychroresistens]|uniref:Histidinol-phosphatase n=1 Tax=Paenibacillus psychroresistens TaxID=1778678 RepID=A0A6B8RH66_9BACL|nr:histidinol-phosphatase [Paenibacillus psychroresistens]QGQ94863.1 histidinol-phosphatase HisJ family protein [Paenibacillus psychroresistens]
MKFDLHTHHYRCGHAEGEIRDYIESAISSGLIAIGISDHSPYFGSTEEQAQPLIAMGKSEFPLYVAEILQLKEEYKDQIDVLLGVESDFFPDVAEFYRAEYIKYPFDYIIGSVHQVSGVSIFNRKRWNKLTESEKVRDKELYYELIQQSARSGMFQILGHIDAMKGFYPPFSEIKTNAVDEALRVIGECKLAIEINTSGSTKDCGGWYPSDDILERALYHGVEVTFGSDAHKPSRVAEDWTEVSKRLKEIGFKDWVYFKQKQRQVVLL